MFDQVLVWGPGCFMGMALPALLSLQFAANSELYSNKPKRDLAQAVLSADGIRHSAQFNDGTAVPPESGKVSNLAKGMWLLTLFVGLAVFLPSQMSVVEDFSRRWTDTIWSSNQRVQKTMRADQVKYIYYSILTAYVLWTFVVWVLFSAYGTPKLMVEVIANFGNLAIGITSFMILRINRKLLPLQLQPRWYHRAGILGCGVFYIGLFVLVAVAKLGPIVQQWSSGS